MSQFSIAIYDNQSPAVFRAEVGPFAEGVKLSTINPGGCAAMTFSIPVDPFGMPVIPAYLGYNYGVMVAYAGEKFWTGRIDDIRFTQGSRGRAWAVTVKGYGVNLGDKLYTTHDVSGQLTSTIVSDVVSTLATQITATGITSTSFTLSGAAPINLNRLTAGAVIAWAARFGNTSFQSMVWYVYPDSFGNIIFVFAPRPTVADVQGYLQDFEAVEFGLTGRQAANEIIVQYNNGGSFVTVDNTTLQGAGPDGWGLIKALVYIMPEITQAVDATQAATALLASLQNLRMSATSLTVKRGAQFLDAYGQGIDPWRIRAGTLFQFRDMMPASGPAGALLWNNSFLIAETAYDEDAQELRIVPESFDVLIDRGLSLVRGMLSGRHTL